MKVTDKQPQSSFTLAEMFAACAEERRLAYRRALEDAAKVADVYTGKTTVGDAIRKLGEDA